MSILSLDLLENLPDVYMKKRIIPPLTLISGRSDHLCKRLKEWLLYETQHSTALLWLFHLFCSNQYFWYLCWDLMLFLFFRVLFSIFLLNSMFTSLFWFSISHILILGFLKCAECPPLHCSIWYFYVWKIYFGGWLFFSFVFKRLSQLSFYIQMLVST